MFKKIVLGILVLVVAVLAFATTKPDSFAVERKISINAPPEKVFANINDFHAWDAWSPWAKLDPAMQTTHSGAPSGPGAVYEWSGNSDVGKGRMEITGATPPSNVTIKLDFLDPFEAHNTAEFTGVLFQVEDLADPIAFSYGSAELYHAKGIRDIIANVDDRLHGQCERILPR